jgi:Flp pilus assembly pilin Flp
MNRVWKIGKSRAQNVVEYGLMIGSIALVVLLGVHSFGQQLLHWFIPLAARITTTGT